MIWPSSNEQRRLSEILLDIYSADDLPEFRQRALTSAQRVFGGELCCHNEINLADGASLSALSQPIGHFEDVRPAFFEHVEDHPSVQHHIQALGTESRAIKTSDFVSQRRWRASGLYSDFYQPLADVRYQITVGQKIDDWLIFFAVSRKHRDFNERERSMLSMLRPHLIQAYRNACDKAQLRSRFDAHNDDSPGFESDAFVFTLMHRFDLTRREAEALIELTQGNSNAVIARTLGISVSTLKTRLERIYRKLDVTTRTAAALKVYEANADGESGSVK